MDNLFEIQRLIIGQIQRMPFYDRECFKRFKFVNQLTGIVGPRGIGKTTFLLHKVMNSGALNNKALYVSADHVYFLDHSLLDLVDKLYKETDVRLLCIDEIHKYTGWQQQLKNISDIYFDFKIIFSGSSQIDLIHGKYDLSRRVTLFHLYGLSFREYLEMKEKNHFSVLTVDSVIENHEDIANTLGLTGIIKHFHDYLKCGYYPFFESLDDEGIKFQAIENITQKIIYEDLGTFHSLKTPTLVLIEKLFKFVLNSSPGELSVYKLASNLGKDFDSLSNYLKYLQEAGLIRFLYPRKSGLSYLRNPQKMYPDNPNLLYAAYLPMASDILIGKARETFVINQVENAGIDLYYSEKGDFILNDYIIEIGGKNKSNKQIKQFTNGILFNDGILTGLKNKIPLYLLGFLY